MNAVAIAQIVEARERVVTEARSWIRTPYHEGGTIKGAGCDCATFIMEVFKACGMITGEAVGYYGREWYVNAKPEDQQYMFRVVRHAFKTVEGVSLLSFAAQPGDIVLVRVAGSKVYNHGGIVTRWPRLIHAVRPEVTETSAANDYMWANLQVVCFDPYAKKFGEQE